MKPSHYIKYLFIAISLIVLQHSTTLSAQNNLSEIDSLLHAKYDSSAPGAVFLISKDGNIIYKKAFGLANLELNVPMKPEDVFEIGSMTKQFTAVSILLLMERGKLDLNDDITKFISDYPTLGKSITIHHLLTHTSGIKNYTSMKEIRGIAKNDLTPLELIDFFKNEPMDFEPGEQFKYNNSGYAILGHIIELLSGQSYASFVEENIFNRLNMASSSYANRTKVIKNRVSGYHKRNDYTKSMYISYTLPYAAGSLMSNVSDMFTWQDALKNNRLVKQSTIEKAFTNYKLNNGDQINYGYGWHIREINGIQSREHGGSIFGFKSMGVYIPSKDVYVVGLNNCDCNSPTDITKEIAKLVIDKN